MKNAVAILLNVTATFITFVILVYALWHAFRAISLSFPVEAIFPLLLLISAAPYAIAFRKISKSTKSYAIGSAALGAVLVILLSPAWYPTLEFTTIFGCIFVCLYINLRQMAVRHVST